MSQSLTKLMIHIVFHIKYNSVKIKREDMSALCAYINGIINNNQSSVYEINGVEDHIHILCRMSKNIALKDLMNKIKSNSSRWLRDKYYYKDFSWQGGYGCFTVSESAIKNVKRYIRNQENHHKKIKTKDEYVELLDKHNIEYDPQYLWDV
ncbi:IS200/IS605 family transposase [Bacteroidales bacterium OttesenSCG-928-K03]|nr:IS200/IS605 family transposase [Odoribacter sp. OttesenSCG-928-L07]MDL2240827.1 IS200/IS605 family transposase [Bacteroidales bacterium OttesenSCG-928-K22]MDL2242391.1 IS200/IS605 family transposase [Bacteroidales bacterium OttesenSCG-928-K03]